MSSNRFSKLWFGKFTCTRSLFKKNIRQKYREKNMETSMKITIQQGKYFNSLIFKILLPLHKATNA